MEEVAQKSKLNFRTKFFYGFGSISFGIKNNGFSFFVLFVYTVSFGLEPWMAGLALNLILIADALTDPLVGYYSDRLRSRWGRRHPFMYAAAIPVTLSYYFLWVPPADLTQWQLFTYLLVCATIIRVFITFYEVPSVALGPELTDSYVDRTSLMSYRYFFGWFGGLTTYNLVWWVFEDKYEGGRFNPELWSEYGLIAAILNFIGIVVTSVGTHRHIPDLIKPPEKKKTIVPEGFQKDKSILNGKLSLSLSLPQIQYTLKDLFLFLPFFTVKIIFSWMLGNTIKFIGFILVMILPQKQIENLQALEYFLIGLAREVVETLTINTSYKFLYIFFHQNLKMVYLHQNILYY